MYTFRVCPSQFRPAEKAPASCRGGASCPSAGLLPPRPGRLLRRLLRGPLVGQRHRRCLGPLDRLAFPPGLLDGDEPAAPPLHVLGVVRRRADDDPQHLLGVRRQLVARRRRLPARVDGQVADRVLVPVLAVVGQLLRGVEEVERGAAEVADDLAGVQVDRGRRSCRPSTTAASRPRAWPCFSSSL